MVLGSETEEEKSEVKKGVGKASRSGGADPEKEKDKKGEKEDVKPKVDSAADEDNDDDGPNFSIAEVSIELTDDLKAKFVQDLSWICSVDLATARRMLEANKWNMQVCDSNF